MPLNVAVVGVGNIGNIHADIYQQHPEYRLVAVCDIIPERADRTSEKHDTLAFYSVQKMLDSGLQIDATSVCSAGEENGGDTCRLVYRLLAPGKGRTRQ